MRSTITLNGKNSSEIAGLLIQTLPPISKPLVRTQIEEIDGRDGDIVTKLGFSAYDKEFTIGLYGDYDVDEVIGYFNSEGTVTFSNEPDKYYYYQIVDQIDFEKLIRFKTATVTMHCQPFKYSTIETPEIFENVDNLISIPDFTKTTNGIKVNVENGVISVNGTGSAATEFYIPITSLTLAEGDYVLRALGNGTSPEACSVRVIYNSPSAANSFGGTYTTLQNNTTVTITATITQDKTYNYIYLYITPNMSLDFTLDLRITVTEGLVSGEGNFINLQETSLVSFNKFDLKGDTDQTNYSGKNLLENKNTTRTILGVTYTKNNDGSVTVNGTATGNSIYPIDSNRSGATRTLVLSAGTYTLNGGTFDGVLLQGYLRQNDTTTYPTGTFEAVDGAQYGVYIRVPQGVEANNLTFYPQLEHGDTKTDYEPYVGGIPSPNPAYPQDVQNVATGPQTINVLGRNLYLPIPTSAANHGISATYDNNTGEIVLSGTGTDTWSNSFDEYPIQLPAGTYTISISNAIPLNTRLRFLSVDGTWVDGTILSTSQSKTTTITVAKPTKNLRLWFSGTNGTNVDNVRFKIQVEYGSNNTEIQPYQSQEYGIGNLYDKNSAYKHNNDAYLDVVLKPNTTYVFNTGRTWTGAFLYDSNNTQTRKVGNDASSTRSVEFTTTADEVKATLVFYFGSADIETYNLNGVVFYEVGTQIELCKIDGYQDYIYKDGNDWYLHEEIGKVVLDGTEGWKGTSGAYYSLPKTDSKVSGLSLATYSDLKMFCSHFTKANYDADTFGSVYSGASNLNFNWDGTHTNLAAFKTWLASNDVRLYAPLATATDTKITDNTLLAQLEPLTSQAYSYDEKTYLVSTSTNLPVIMSVEAIKANKATITNSGNTIAKPTLTIYGAGDIGVYLNGFQVFKVALGDEGYITIDTNLMEAYKDTPDNLKNRLVDGDYTNFVLLQGESQITFSGSVDRCVIENYSRWL